MLNYSGKKWNDHLKRAAYEKGNKNKKRALQGFPATD